MITINNFCLAPLSINNQWHLTISHVSEVVFAVLEFSNDSQWHNRFSFGSFLGSQSLKSAVIYHKCKV